MFYEFDRRLILSHILLKYSLFTTYYTIFCVLYPLLDLCYTIRISNLDYREAQLRINLT